LVDVFLHFCARLLFRITLAFFVLDFSFSFLFFKDLDLALLFPGGSGSGAGATRFEGKEARAAEDESLMAVAGTGAAWEGGPESGSWYGSRNPGP